MELSQASREIMWNISHPWVMYLLFITAMCIFGFGIYKRVNYWKKGKAEGERFSDWGKRAFILIREILLQNRVRNSKFPGIFHSFIFYSFLTLIVTTAIIASDYDFGTSFFNGYIYVFFTVAAETAGLFILIGVLMAAYRRYIKKTKTVSSVFDDHWSLLLIGLLVVTGFLAEGLRIAVIGDQWKWLSPVGWAVSFLFNGVSPEGGKIIHVILWWTHTVLAMGWIASIPYTKFFHILALPTNVFFSKLTPRGELKRIDLEALMESEDFEEESFQIGAQKPDDLTWKQRLDFDACISCGRCEEVCPSFLANQPFSPKTLINNLKKLSYSAANNPVPQPQSAGADAVSQSKDIVGNAFDEDFIWFCRTCTACMEVCPALIEHVDTLIDVRRNEVVMQGRMPADAARALKMLENLGNPFGPQSDRVDWLKEVGVRVVGKGESCDVIYWIGCCTTFDPTKRKISADLFALLRKCGIDFGVLGTDEKCCGDPARVLGQEHLFQQVAKKQVEELNSRNFKVLITACPHCYNVLKNEYPQFGGKYNVVHHSEFIHEMLWGKHIVPEIGAKRRVVYHDPCYLGRYQKIYDSPREALKTIPGTEIVEMANSMQKSLCCGGGGGHYWMDLKKGDRINNLRVEQAMACKADTIVTGCAYCKHMLEDSVKLMNQDENIRVVDIATIVLESLDDNLEEPSQA